MEIRDHAKLRYVQRVLGIGNVKEARKYIKENEFEVAYRILEFINDSSLFYKSFAPSRGETFDYYINGEVLIVMGREKSVVITLYHVTLDSKSKINSKKIREYIKQITKNNHLVKTLRIQHERQDKITSHLEYMIDRLRGEIDESKMVAFEIERNESIEKCKELIAQNKGLRVENREMMAEMFTKIDIN
jgi:alpha-amylase/alpha-mannosidase (GH57 family)